MEVPKTVDRPGADKRARTPMYRTLELLVNSCIFSEGLEGKDFCFLRRRAVNFLPFLGYWVP